MYKFIKIKKIIKGGNFDFFSNKLIVVTKDNPHTYVSILDLNGEKKISIDSYSAYGFFIDRKGGNLFFTNSEATKTYCYSIKNNDLKALKYVLHMKGYLLGNKYLCYSEIDNEERYLIINTDNFEVDKKLDKKLGFGEVNKWFGELFFSKRNFEGVLGCFNINNECIWQKDISELCGYADVNKFFIKGEIK